MSHMMPRRVVAINDPLTEHLKNLQPEQVDALQMMRGVYSNQVVLSAALVSSFTQQLTADSAVNSLLKGN
ncbi:hypothetical protein VITU102760_12235 [Vibrio tubiashii]|uniref:Uncharacterized protein n=1 Tax=Vibrio tubiashii ATCC 19109 TaxID=1051646 RepID=F9SZY9_9VIBR|nr:hypothetical protein [Vibrio tubiashii]AIW16282.1 hypothetical protein IX91_19500 [Vibrio tubiashii ATCC 19109]EGU59067.1 hypothetical protein VITU9109_18975 [Vibrio tubiashii ATCC 19109]EIF05931.1 hypothetical protein VT1337_00785 [Vibrio tubiashii NCIMB 1337 = ATCC 19106]